jgi:SPP1 family predicted phage head-tail adaptor
MIWRDIIDLISETTTSNDLGDYIDSPTSTQVFANKKSIKRNEFYQALSNGLRPEVAFEIRSIDYNNQDRLSYNSQTYNIIRTYSKNDEIIELICNRLVNTN